MVLSLDVATLMREGGGRNEVGREERMGHFN